MATLHESLSPELQTLIAKQKLFFVATAPDEGRLNISPKVNAQQATSSNRIRSVPIVLPNSEPGDRA